jgi:hypothetical protein
VDTINTEKKLLILKEKIIISKVYNEMFVAITFKIKKKKIGDLYLYRAYPALPAALGAESRVCYPGNMADRQTQ